MTIEAPTEARYSSPDQVLGPQLQPGDVVVMDNLAAHKVAGVSRGAAPSSSICHPTRPIQPHRTVLGSGQATAARRQGPLASRA